ncbi:PD-(D/E)XK nuclease family protein [Marininema halotolerans]|uniref:ATP-dependent helicase/DNAse subunit B n=1 Tax=Marininema halotolerans TaxID=1155944 RepID=A0A1I6RR62_9BACL|nr:PD-(D/E)XK nuclease family protein [Marininema halotolerans]SFS67162.1 ATP-dependent helicase/DNAse subunit B [Marininema halotolerans]
MSARIVLHPAIEAVRGMSLSNLDIQEEQGVVYLIPSAQSLGEYKRLLHHRGFSGEDVHLTTFDAFVRGLLPSSSGHFMSRMEQEWLARRAVEEGICENPGYFQGMTDHKGWLKKVEARIGELKRAGIRPDRLTALWKDHGEGYPELARVFQTYDRLLKQQGLLDHEEPYFLVMDGIRRQAISLPDRVVAEHFPDLSFLQEQLLIQLVTAGVSVELHLAWDEKRPRLFKETKELCDRLKKRGFHMEKRSCHSAGKRRDSLTHLAQQIFSSEPKQVESSDVKVLAAPGVEQEVTSMVARLKRWLEESDSPLGEVALVTNQASIYFPLLFPALEEAGIPCARSWSRPLREHPLIQMIVAALSLQGMEERGIPLVLESPFLPWLSERRTRLSWTVIWKRLGSPVRSERLTQRIEGVTEDELENWEISVEELRALTDVFRWMEAVPQQPQSWVEWINWFQGWVKPLDDPERKRSLAQDPMLLPLLAEEWKAWVALKEIMVTWQEMFEHRVFGDPLCDHRQFISALEQATEAKQVERKPGRRGGVHLLEPNQIRGDRYRGVFLFGCVEGEWPRPIREDWLISDDERERLRSEGVQLAFAREQRLRQLIPFFQSVCAAEETIVFSYPASNGEGKKRLPSPYLDEVKRLFPPGGLSESILDISEMMPLPWQECTSLHKGLERGIAILSQTEPGNQSKREHDVARSIIKGMREKMPAYMEGIDEKIRVEKERQDGKEGSVYQGYLSPSVWGTTEDMTNRIWSVSQLNELMQCRFHFFARRVLHTSSTPDDDEGITPMERGELMHRILCRFWDRYRIGGLPQLEVAEEVLTRISHGVWQEFVSNDQQARNPHHLHIEQSRLIRRMLGMIQHEWHWREQEDVADFRPMLLEYSFGMPMDEVHRSQGEVDPASKEEPITLGLANGKHIRLRGKVDRVDQDDRGRYILYDYKSGNAPDVTQMKAGAYLQLPLYLWALQKEFSFDERKALGISFFTAGRGKNGQPPMDNRNKGLWRKEEAKSAGISGRVAGLFSEEEWDEIMNQIRGQVTERLDRVSRGDFAVEPTWECPSHCSYRGICRVKAYDH